MSKETQNHIKAWARIFLPAILSAIATVAVLQWRMGSLERAVETLTRKTEQNNEQVIRYDERIQNLTREIDRLRGQLADQQIDINNLKALREGLRIYGPVREERTP